MEQLFFAGKDYLKINSLVKTPLRELMVVERSGLWAPETVLFDFLRYNSIGYQFHIALFLCLKLLQRGYR